MIIYSKYTTSEFLLQFHFYSLLYKLTCILRLEHETTDIVQFLDISGKNRNEQDNHTINFFGRTNFNQKNIYSILLSTVYPYKELINLSLETFLNFVIFHIHLESRNDLEYEPRRSVHTSEGGKGPMKIDFPRD